MRGSSCVLGKTIVDVHVSHSVILALSLYSGSSPSSLSKLLVICMNLNLRYSMCFKIFLSKMKEKMYF